MPTHHYTLQLDWKGNTGSGTSGYRAYERAHEVIGAGKPPILMSSDPSFRGDGTRYNPEELLVASLSSCHMLWYLHLAADSGIVVTGYSDEPQGTMTEGADGSGMFTEVVLRPRVTVRAGANAQLAEALHERAHAMCFIASSVIFPVRCEPQLVVDQWTPAIA